MGARLSASLEDAGASIPKVHRSNRARPGELLYYLFQNLRRFQLRLMASCSSPAFCPQQAKLTYATRLPAKLLGAVLLLFFAHAASGQSKLVPGIEVFGGYSHLTFDSGSLGFGKWTQMNGFDAGISIPHIIKGLGVAVDASGDYATALEQYNYAVGPQYKWEFSHFRFIAHVMYGRSQTRIRQPGSTFVEPSDRQRSLLFGGELDLPLKGRISWRAVQGDYVVTSAFGNNFSNIRLSTGLIYRFGKP
jgi:hypothetical protein